MPIGNTTYSNGSVNTQIHGGQTYNSGIDVPSAEGLLDANSMRRLLDQRAREKAQEKRMADQGSAQQRQVQQQAMRPAKKPTLSYHERAMQDLQLKAMRDKVNAPTTETNWVKWMQFPGAPGGYMRVPAGTPGAVASGQVPIGQGLRTPDNAGFSSAGTVDDDARAQREDAEWDRFVGESANRAAIDRFGAQSPATYAEGLGGTTPILTPQSVSKQQAQQQQNAMYGRR